MIRFLSGVGLAVIILTGVANADSLTLITNRSDLSVNDRVDWGLFGPTYTDIVSGSVTQSQNGIGVTVTQPFYALQVLQQNDLGTDDGGFAGDFSPGQSLLTWTAGFRVTVTFSQPVYGAGVQIGPGEFEGSQFTAYVTAYDGSDALGTFSTTGDKSYTGNGTAPFLGVQSDIPDITALTYSVITPGNVPLPQNDAMNSMSLLGAVTPVSEPSTIVLMTTGLACLSTLLRKCFCRTPAKHRSRSLSRHGRLQTHYVRSRVGAAAPLPQ